MIITVATPTDVLAGVDTGAAQTVADLKQILSPLVHMPLSRFSIVFDNRALRDDEPLSSALGSSADVVVQVLPTEMAPAGPGSAPRSLAELPAESKDPRVLVELLTRPGHEHLLRELRFNNADLARAVEARDVAQVRSLLMMQSFNRHKVDYEQQQKLQRLSANPDSAEAQREIERMIRQEEVNKQMELAMEETPEAFGSVHMLYVNCEINGTAMKAFVDSGAQMTIMSHEYAERCGIARLMDDRWQGMAKGVGSGKILGRIHLAQLKLGGSFFPVTFTVLESSDIEVIIGLDMLRRHRCTIDLRDNCLRVEGASGEERVPFLSEADIAGKFGSERPAEGESKDAQPPSSASASASASAPAPAQPPAAGAALQGLVAMGFPQDQAAAALAQAGGDVELAAQLLLASRDA